MEEGLFFLSLCLLLIFFWGDPNLMDAIISYLECKQ